MLAETPEGFRAYVDIVEDRAFDGFGADELLAAVGDEYRWGFLIVGDQMTMTDAEHSLLQSIENNLSIANMDFWELADSADGDGVFRGFAQPEPG